ncbi:MAG: tetratricopeptide repeat protein [Chloroflexota bacterium]
MIVGGGGGGDPDRAAFSDSHPFNAQVWSLFADQAETRDCSVDRADPVSMDLETAVANTRQLLDREAGSGALEAFDASPDASSADKATAAAVAAVLSSNKAGALAALLAAARDEPDDPRHLVNAAGLLPDFDLASEALAFLDAAEGMGAPASTPYGLDQRAVLLNNRGRALLALQRWDDAASVLQEAYELDPALAEAATNLSLALLCQGQRDEAMSFARAGRYRENPGFTEKDGVSTPKPEDVYDLDSGVGATDGLIPPMELPQTPGDGVAQRPSLSALKQEVLDRTIQAATDTGRLLVEVAGANPPPITKTRNDDIMLAISAINTDDGAVAAEWQAVTETSDAAFAVWDEHFGPAGTVEQLSDACGGDDWDGCMRTDCIPTTASAHSEWLGHLEDLDAALRTWADAYYPMATAIAGHIGNPGQYQLAMLTIQGQLDQAFLTLVSRAEEFAISEDHDRELCVEGFGPEPEAPELTDAPGGEPCSMPTGDWSITIAGVSISIECSDWTLEASTPGPIGAFLQVSSKGGETTIFCGPTASLSIGPFSAGSKSGFYLTSSPTTGVRDFGYRVEPASVGLTGGPISLNAASMESMDFSFVGITAYLPGV